MPAAISGQFVAYSEEKLAARPGGSVNDFWLGSRKAARKYSFSDVPFDWASYPNDKSSQMRFAAAVASLG